MKLQKIIATGIIVALTAAIVGLSLEEAAAKAEPVSKSVVLTLRVIPSAAINIEEETLDKSALSLDSDKLTGLIASKDKDMSVDRVLKDGRQAIMITRIAE